MLRVGVLALQGDFREHAATVRSLGADVVEVRLPKHLEALDAFIIPGGESTTIGRLAVLYGLVEPMRDAIGAGLPVLGTCAGMIILASGTLEGDQPQLGALDVVVRRNAFGRQVDSYEAPIEVAGWSEPMVGVFIRAPWIAKAGDDVEVLASVEDADTGESHPVFVRQGTVLATAFHPELTQDTRVHEMLLSMAAAAKED
ncbi:MAG: pyridoxal 5'-phosphate synthase glutaminase subunit PdxT [Acidimicrobiia bacterium]|nr:pyridoxal 5'-phosphate synthase glutaminase subunit PdxT [Acidimicrobiia bacterium]